MSKRIETQIKDAMAYTREAYPQQLEKFKSFLKIPSISADPSYKNDILHAAQWIVDELNQLGFEKCAALPSERYPVVYGEWLKSGEDKPTILIYAHYDVQPVDPLELWITPPFEPDIRENKLFARGAIDDKCGVMVHLNVFEAFLKTLGRLPLNVKVFFEGGEESASPGMREFIVSHKNLLKADFLLVSDGGSLPDLPTLIYASRGIISAEISVDGPEFDVHSGSLGGVVHNPIHHLSKIIASFHDVNGRILISGFYDDVEKFSDQERDLFLKDEALRIEEMKKVFGDFKIWGDSAFSFDEKSTAMPALDINGIFGGYGGKGEKTIIPSSCGCKLSLRLVNNQNPDDIVDKLIRHVHSFDCPTVTATVSITSAQWPAQMMKDSYVVDIIKKCYETVWGKAPQLIREGGSVPVLGIFQRELAMPMTFLGFGVGGNGHSPNEYLELEYFQKGMDMAIHFFSYMGE